MAKKNKHIQDLKNENNYFRYLVELLNVQTTQFVYTGLPETIPAEFLELYLTVNGSVGIGKPKGEQEIYCAMGSYHGNVKGYLPDSYAAAVVGIDDIDGKINESVVVGINNLSRTPDYDIAFTANLLNEIDISENVNVIFTRLSRLPFADNDKEKAQIEQAIKAIIKGDPLAVASRYCENVFDEFLREGKKEKERFFDLVEPEKINCLQYLNQFRDNIFKRFLIRRGYMFNVTSKLAQQTNDEIHGSDKYSVLYPIEQLECRKKMCENLKKVFDIDVTVDFNPVLKLIVDSVLNPKTEEQAIESGEKNNNESVGDDNGVTEEDSSNIENNE